MTQTLYIIAFLASSLARAFSCLAVAACDLMPMMPPPHERSIALAFSLYCWRMAVTSWLNSCRSCRAAAERGEAGVSGRQAAGGRRRAVRRGDGLGWRRGGAGRGEERRRGGEEGGGEKRRARAKERRRGRGAGGRGVLAQRGGAGRGRGGAHLAADGGERERGGGLLVDERAQARLALDDAVRDVHLAADRGQPHHELPRQGGGRVASTE